MANGEAISPAPLTKVTVTYASLRAGLMQKAAMRGLGAGDRAELKRHLDLFSPLLLAYIEDLFLDPAASAASSVALPTQGNIMAWFTANASKIAALFTAIADWLNALAPIAKACAAKAVGVVEKANGVILAAILADLPTILADIAAFIKTFTPATT